MPERLSIDKAAEPSASLTRAEPIKFAHYLEAKARGVPGKRSGRRTRLRLMAATADLLEEMTFDTVNVIDICNAADVAKGTFYLQFETKEEVILAIFNEYVDFEIRTMPVLDPDGESYEVIYTIISWYEQTFRINAGIMRNFVRMSDIDLEVADLWKRRNEQIVDRGLAPYLENASFRKKDEKWARLIVRTMGGIMDYSLFAQSGIHKASDFNDDASGEQLIQLHSLLMYRALYGEDPDLGILSPDARMFAVGARPKTKKE